MNHRNRSDGRMTAALVLLVSAQLGCFAEQKLCIFSEMRMEKRCKQDNMPARIKCDDVVHRRQTLEDMRQPWHAHATGWRQRSPKWERESEKSFDSLVFSCLLRHISLTLCSDKSSLCPDRMDGDGRSDDRWQTHCRTHYVDFRILLLCVKFIQLFRQQNTGNMLCLCSTCTCFTVPTRSANDTLCTNTRTHINYVAFVQWHWQHATLRQVVHFPLHTECAIMHSFRNRQWISQASPFTSSARILNSPSKQFSMQLDEYRSIFRNS